MSTYTWEFGAEGSGLHFTVVYDSDANTFTVNGLEGSFDLNALWFSDGDGTSDGYTLTKSDSSLNMNGSTTVWDEGTSTTEKITWDDYQKLSSTGLGSEGVDKDTYITAGDSETFAASEDFDPEIFTTLGVRATSVNGGDSIKWADTEAEVSEDNTEPTVDATDPSGFTEEEDASAQDLSNSGTVSFDDVDATDVVDITFASNDDIEWSGGAIDAGLATALVAGFSVTTVTDADAPGSTPWSYSANDLDLDFLADGETITFSYTITATDSQGATATDTVSFTITGTNDGPTIDATDSAGFTEDEDASAQDLSDSGTVGFDDVDTNDVVDISAAYDGNLTWSGGAVLPAGVETALTSGTFTATASDEAAPGSTPWSYSANDVNLDFLGEDETLTFSFTVTATDGQDATATDVVSFTITGTNDGPTIDATDPAGFTEAVDASAQDLSDSGTVNFDDVDANDVVDITYAYDNNILWSGGTIDAGLAAALVAGFSVTTVTDAAAPGSTPWSYSANDLNLDFLAEDETITFSYTVTATDDKGASATDTVSLTIDGTNDAPTAPVFHLDVTATTTSGDIIGTFTSTDAEGDPITFVETVDPANEFDVIGDGLTLSDGLAANTTQSVTVVANDGLADSASTTVNVRVGVDNGSTGDTITGTAGVDVIFGLAGADSITGSGAGDGLLGGSQGDTLDGGLGDDTIVGGDGDDSILGGDGADSILGAGGADTLNGGMANDVISGGAGNDIILGGDDVDALNGDGNNDTITGGLGADAMSGGANNDVFVIGNSDSGLTLLTADTISDFGVGSDDLSLGVAGSGTNYLEAGAAVADFDTALIAADAALNGTVIYSFQWDATSGYLFEDSNSDGTADQVIVLTGINNTEIASGDILA